MSGCTQFFEKPGIDILKNPWKFFGDNVTQQRLTKLLNPLPRQTCQFLMDLKSKNLRSLGILLIVVSIVLYFYVLSVSKLAQDIEQVIIFVCIGLIISSLLLMFRQSRVHSRLIKYYNHAYCSCVNGAQSNNKCYMYQNPYLKALSVI